MFIDHIFPISFKIRIVYYPPSLFSLFSPSLRIPSLSCFQSHSSIASLIIPHMEVNTQCSYGGG